MIVEWSYENWTWTLAALLLGIIFIWWSVSKIGRAGLILGMGGLWLLLVEPHFISVLDKKSMELDNIPEFLISEHPGKTDSILLRGLRHPLEELALLDSFILTEADGNEISSGFSAINYESKITEGEEIIINGAVFLKDSIKVNVTLHTPENKTVSTEVLQDGSFEFKTEVPSTGLFTYQLMMDGTSSDSISEKIPVVVEEAKKLSMLIYASSPRFELNYLKNHWVAEGHGIIQKVKVSADRFNTTTINSDVQEFQILNSKVLNELDVLLMDIQMWNGLTPGERSRVTRGIKEQGKALLLLPSVQGVTAQGIPYHRLIGIETSELEETEVLKADFAVGSAWNIEDYGWKCKIGYGNILLLRWDETYKLLLKDRKARYRSLWTRIFSESFTSYANGFRASAPLTARTGENIDLNLSGISQNDTLIINDKQLAVLNTPYLESYGLASIRAQEGWNEVRRLNDDESAWFYVHGEQSWMTMREMRVRDEINKMATRNANSISATYEITRKLPWWIPLFIFILGMGITWLSEKLA